MRMMIAVVFLMLLLGCGPSIDKLVDLESGMTKKEVIKLLGKPKKVERDFYNANDIVDSWFYWLYDDGDLAGHQWLYFRNGILFSWDSGQPQQERYQIEVK